MNPVAGRDRSFLQYASVRPAALKAEEVILWQGGPIFALSASGATEEAGLTFTSSIDRYYFITDQRLICTTEGTKFLIQDRPLQPPAKIIVIKPDGDKVANVTIDHFTMRCIEDWRGVSKLIAGFPRKTNEHRMRRGKWIRRRVRRAGTQPTGTQPAATLGRTMNDPLSDVAADFPLLEGEKILWSGRPAKWKRFSFNFVWRTIYTLGMLIIPGGVVAIRYFDHQSDRTLNWIIYSLAAFWAAAALWSVFVKPFTEAARRNQTRYFFTGLRAIRVAPMGRSRKIEMVFLDGLGPKSEVIEHPDGSGDIKVGFQLTFDGVANAREVYQVLMETIQSAERTFEGTIPDANS